MLQHVQYCATCSPRLSSSFSLSKIIDPVKSRYVVDLNFSHLWSTIASCAELRAGDVLAATGQMLLEQSPAGLFIIVTVG